MAGSNKLTERGIRSEMAQAKASGVAKKLFDGGGLYLELTGKGGAYWRWKYRHAGRENRLSLGTFPATTLAAAREAHKAQVSALQAGTDPSAARKLAKMAQDAPKNTFDAVSARWLKVRATEWSEGHTHTIRSRLHNDLLPYIGGRPLSELGAPELLATLRRIEDRGAIESAHRCKMICKQVFDFALAEGIVIANPAQALGAALQRPPDRHHAALVDPAEVGRLMCAMRIYKGSPVTRAAFLISAYTFQRPGEIRAMEWCEVDMATAMWSIPAKRMKGTVAKKATAQPHRVPLSRQAIEVLTDLQQLTGGGVHVFPGERGGGRCMSENTLRAALRGLGYSNEEMTAHGFRAMARTLIGEGFDDVQPDVVEAQLAHGKSGPLGSAYDRAEFMPKRVALMQRWADLLDNLASRVPSTS